MRAEDLAAEVLAPFDPERALVPEGPVDLELRWWEAKADAKAAEYARVLAEFRLALNRTRPRGTQTPFQQIGHLQGQLERLRGVLSRQHRGLVILADLRQELGSMAAVVRAYARATGRSESSAERAVSRWWAGDVAPRAETLAELEALRAGDELDERAQRLAAYAARAAAGESLF